jgi:hypothetical protein
MNAFENSRFTQERSENAHVFSDVAASSQLVNRTHRVVRYRAQEMKARRSYIRSLLVPLAICSALLILSISAAWTGLYESQNAADALQDVSSTIAAASDNQFMVVLFWFVPVTLAVMGTVWLTRTRDSGRIGR